MRDIDAIVSFVSLATYYVELVTLSEPLNRNQKVSVFKKHRFNEKAYQMVNGETTSTKEIITFAEVAPIVVPPSLLLEADPSATNIATYLLDSWCFVAKRNDQIVAACVIKKTDPSIAEVFNIAVSPEYQGNGWGTSLLKHAIQFTRKKKIERLEIGTGTFGYQLAFYQRMGFRASTVITNHFLDNYDEPIWENGVQHKDMLRLYLDL